MVNGSFKESPFRLIDDQNNCYLGKFPIRMNTAYLFIRLQARIIVLCVSMVRLSAGLYCPTIFLPSAFRRKVWTLQMRQVVCSPVIAFVWRSWPTSNFVSEAGEQSPEDPSPPATTHGQRSANSAQDWPLCRLLTSRMGQWSVWQRFRATMEGNS